jgi:hypothetical protein
MAVMPEDADADAALQLATARARASQRKVDELVDQDLLPDPSLADEVVRRAEDVEVLVHEVTDAD